MIAKEVFLSVIICTFRRLIELECNFNSLIVSNGPNFAWELIVVENDDAPNPALGDLVYKYSLKLPLKLVFQKGANLSKARNLGARSARGEYIAYIDDDAEVDKSWLKNVIEGCKEYSPDFMGGPAFPLYKTKKPGWFKDSYATSIYLGEKPRVLNSREYLSGMNLIIRRELILSLGGFREELGMSGGNIWWGEETDLQKRARNFTSGIKIQYNPAVCVFHLVRPEKMTLRWQLRASYTKAASALMGENFQMTRLEGARKLFCNCMNLAINIPGLLLYILVDLFRKPHDAFKSYIKERILNYVARICVLFKYIATKKLTRNT
jgi:glycosyltransferase involved in cell wall biosynthesis